MMKTKMMVIAVVSFILIIFTAYSSFASPPEKAKIAKTANKVKVLVTAYYKPVPGQKKYASGSYKKDVRINGTGKTFTEKEIKVGFAAADLKHFPPGTKLHVPGHGKVIVEDIGGSVKGRHIDIFVGKGDQGLEKALNWGKQKVEVIVLAWGK